MIRVAVSENQVFELVWRTAKPADRPEDGCLLTPEPGIDQRQAIVAFDQEGVCHPHRDHMDALDHKLHGHGQTLHTAYVCAANARPLIRILKAQRKRAVARAAI